jgi:hypothetical protein
VLGREIDPRRRLERLDANQVAVVALATEVERHVELVLAAPEQGPQLEVVEPQLLGELPPQRHLVGLARVHSAAGRRPRERRELEVDEQDSIARIEHEGAHAPSPRLQAEAFASARNQRRRSFHATAAFAGDVEGRTKSRVSASRRSCSPSSGRSLNTPR